MKIKVNKEKSEMILGNIGSVSIKGLDFTGIGDTVNSVARCR